MSGIPELARGIKLLVLDVDGVLTDGRLYLSGTGDEFKCFHVHDGFGIKAVMAAGIGVAIISNRQSPAVTARMTELGVGEIHQGVADKKTILADLLAKRGLGSDQAAYVGDDLPDLEVMALVGLPIAVADAQSEVLKAAQWVTTLPGGAGAVREVCNLLLRASD